MKLSEHDTPNRLREIARTYLKSSQHYALEEVAVMADKWEQAEAKNAILEAKLTAIPCGSCEKNLLECKCDD